MKKIYTLGLFCGLLSSFIYIAHVFIGGILWEGYSHIIQPISDLTGIDGPNREFLLMFTHMYGFLAVIFSISAYILIRTNGSRLLNSGFIILIVMETVSWIGYSLFPLDSSGVDAMTFQNIMHIVVTIIVVLCTLSFLLLLGLGFSSMERTRDLGRFVLLACFVVFSSGIMSGVVIANEIPITGLIERINIFTLQLLIFILSSAFLKKYISDKSLRYV